MQVNVFLRRHLVSLLNHVAVGRSPPLSPSQNPTQPMVLCSPPARAPAAPVPAEAALPVAASPPPDEVSLLSGAPDDWAVTLARRLPPSSLMSNIIRLIRHHSYLSGRPFEQHGLVATTCTCGVRGTSRVKAQCYGSLGGVWCCVISGGGAGGVKFQGRLLPGASQPSQEDMDYSGSCGVCLLPGGKTCISVGVSQCQVRRALNQYNKTHQTTLSLAEFLYTVNTIGFVRAAAFDALTNGYPCDLKHFQQQFQKHISQSHGIDLRQTSRPQNIRTSNTLWNDHYLSLYQPLRFHYLLRRAAWTFLSRVCQLILPNALVYSQKFQRTVCGFLLELTGTRFSGARHSASVQAVFLHVVYVVGSKRFQATCFDRAMRALDMYYRDGGRCRALRLRLPMGTGEFDFEHAGPIFNASDIMQIYPIPPIEDALRATWSHDFVLREDELDGTSQRGTGDRVGLRSRRANRELEACRRSHDANPLLRGLGVYPIKSLGRDPKTHSKAVRDNLIALEETQCEAALFFHHLFHNVSARQAAGLPDDMDCREYLTYSEEQMEADQVARLWMLFQDARFRDAVLSPSPGADSLAWHLARLVIDPCEMQQLLEVRVGYGIADTKPLCAAMAAVTELQHDASADPFPAASAPPDSDTAWCPIWNTRPDAQLRQESTRDMNVLIPAEFQCHDQNIPPDPSVLEPGRLAISTVRGPDGGESLVSLLLEDSSVAGGDLQYRFAFPAAGVALHIVSPPRLLPSYSTCTLLVRLFRRHIMLRLLGLAREGVITSAAVSACRECRALTQSSSKRRRGVISLAGDALLNFLRAGHVYGSPRGTLDTPFPEHLSSTAKLCQYAVNHYYGPRLLCRTGGRLRLEVVIRIMQALVDRCTPPPGAPSGEPAHTIVLEPQLWASRGGELDRRDDGYDLYQGGHDTDEEDDDVDGSYAGSESDDEDQDGPPDEGPVCTARPPISGGPSSSCQDHYEDAVFADCGVEQHPTNEHGPTGHAELGTSSGPSGQYLSKYGRCSRGTSQCRDTLFYLPDTIRIQTPPPATLGPGSPRLSGTLSPGGPRLSGACFFGVNFFQVLLNAVCSLCSTSPAHDFPVLPRTSCLQCTVRLRAAGVSRRLHSRG